MSSLLALGQQQYLAYPTNGPAGALGNSGVKWELPDAGANWRQPRCGVGFLPGRGVARRPVRLTNEPWVDPILSSTAALGCFEWLSCALLPAYLCACQRERFLIIWKCREATETPCGGGCLSSHVKQRYFELGLK